MAQTPEKRLVRYGWLRVLFSRAEEPDQPAASPDHSQKGTEAPSNAQPTPLTTSELLQAAQMRLTIDLAQTDVANVGAPAHAAERNAMKQVLAGRDFRNLEQPTVRDSILEKVGNWLNRLFESATRWRARSAWVGRLIVWLFILGVCIALVWGLLQLERRWRVRLVPEQRTPRPEQRRLATGSCGLMMRGALLHPGNGERRFISSTGRRFRGWSRGVCGPRIAPVRRASISLSSHLRIRDAMGLRH